MTTTKNGVGADYAPRANAYDTPQSEANVSEEETYDADDAYLDPEEDDMAWGEESGSARYVLGGELVRQGYAPLDAHFSQTPIHVTAHVLPNAGEAATGHADGYEEAFAAWALQYPHRVARLRDLYFRVKAARQKRVLLEERDETIRIAHNERNNANNERITGDLDKLRSEWATRRRETEAELAKTRQTLVERETALLSDAEDAEKALWNLRKTLAEEWDAEIAEKQKRDAERETARQKERDRQEGLQQESDFARAEAVAEARTAERAQALVKQTENEAAAKTAFDELHEARAAVAEARAAEIKTADAALADAEREAQGEWDAAEREVIEAASAARAHYEAGRETRQAETNAARQRIAQEQGILDDAVTQAEERRNDAAGRAGVPASDVEEKGVRDAVFAHVPASRTGAGSDPEEHLSPEEAAQNAAPTFWRVVQRAGQAIGEWFCLLAFGSIFGTSLGLLFEAFTFGQLKDPELLRSMLGIWLLLCAVGVGVFAVMGRAIEYFVTLAARSWRRGGSRSVALVVLATVIVFLFIGVEATVERYGIVGAFAESQRLANLGDQTKIDAVLAANQWAYWAIALIAALPFVAQHVGIAWLRANHESAVAETRAAQADAERAFLERPAVGELVGAQGALEAARARAASGSESARLLAGEAERRLAEHDAGYETHPARMRREEIADIRQAFFGDHPGLWFVRDARVRLQAEIDAHPEVATAKTRYEFYSAQAGVIKAWLAQSLLESGAFAGQELLARAGNVAGDVLENVANGVSNPAHAFGTEARNVADAVFGFSAGDPALVAPVSQRERTAEARLSEERERLQTDPTVRYCRDRIKSLQGRLVRMEEGYKKRITSLKKQRRAIDLAPGKTCAAELADAEAQILSAQLQFEQEYGRLLRLSELPVLLRWFSHLRQVWLRPDGIVSYAENANRIRPALSAVALPASEKD